MSKKVERSRVRKLGKREAVTFLPVASPNATSPQSMAFGCAGRELRWLVLSVKGAAFLIGHGAAPHKMLGLPAGTDQESFPLRRTTSSSPSF